MTRLIPVLLAGLIAAGTVHAQSAATRWPERPIRLIVPFTPGSSSDTVARLAFAKQGVEPEPGSAEALGARIRDDVKKWRDVITSAGIRTN